MESQQKALNSVSLEGPKKYCCIWNKILFKLNTLTSLDWAPLEYLNPIPNMICVQASSYCKYLLLCFKIRKKKSHPEGSISGIFMPQADWKCKTDFSQMKRHHAFQPRTRNFSCCQDNFRILAPRLAAWAVSWSPSLLRRHSLSDQVQRPWEWTHGENQPISFSETMRPSPNYRKSRWSLSGAKYISMNPFKNNWVVLSK